jgi:hypothetical protein
MVKKANLFKDLFCISHEAFFPLKISSVVEVNNVYLLQVWQGNSHINMWTKRRFFQWLDGINRCSNKEIVVIYISTYVSQVFRP